MPNSEEYVYTFEVNGAQEAATGIGAVGRAALEAAGQLNALATAWNNVATAMRSLPGGANAATLATIGKQAQAAAAAANPSAGPAPYATSPIGAAPGTPKFDPNEFAGRAGGTVPQGPWYNPSGGIWEPNTAPTAGPWNRNAGGRWEPGVEGPWRNVSNSGGMGQFNPNEAWQKMPTGNPDSAGGGDPNDFMSKMGRRLTFMGEWYAFTEVLHLITEGFKAWSEATSAMDAQLTAFQQTVTTNAGALQEYKEQVSAISERTRIAPAEIAEGLTLQKRVPGAPGDLAERAGEVQRMTGIDNVAVSRSLLGLAGQFPGAGGLGNILDSFIGAQSKSALKPAEMFGMLETAGPVSKQMGVDMKTMMGMYAGASSAAPAEGEQGIELFWRQMNRIYEDPGTRSAVESRIGSVSGINRNTGSVERRSMYDIMSAISQLPEADRQAIAETIPQTLGQKNRAIFQATTDSWGQKMEPAVAAAYDSQGQWQRRMDLQNASVEGYASQSAQKRTSLFTGDSAPMKFLHGAGSALWDWLAEYQDGGKGDDSILGGLDQKLGLWGLAGKTMNYGVRAAMGKDLPGSERRNPFAASAGANWAALRAIESETGETGSAAWLPSLPEKRLQFDQRGLDVGDVNKAYEAAKNKAIAELEAFNPAYKGQDKKVLAGIAGFGDEEKVLIQTADGLKEVYGNAEQLTEVLGKLGASMKEAGRGDDYGLSWRGDKFSRAGSIGMGFDTSAMTEQDVVKQLSVFQGMYQKSYQQTLEGIRKHEPEFASQFPQTPEGNRQLMEQKFPEQPIVVYDEANREIDTFSGNMSIANTALMSFAGTLSSLVGLNVPYGMSTGTYMGLIDQGKAAFAQNKGGLDPTLLGGPPVKMTYQTPEGGFENRSFGSKAEADYVGRYASGAASDSIRAANEGKAEAQRQQALLERIAKATESFVDGLLKPTPVTAADMARSKVGGYQDKWDEPVRRVRAAVDNRVALKGVGESPWSPYAQGLGIDLSSADAAMASGADFEDKYYNGGMSPEFYEKNAKGGFLNAAKKELADRQGRKALQQQAMGWLKEGGMSDEVAKTLSEDMTGTSTPLVKMLFGDKSPTEVGKEITPQIKTALSGTTSALKEIDWSKSWVESWNLDDKKTKEAVVNLGKDLGGLLRSGVEADFKDKLVETIKQAVLAELKKK